MSEHGPPLQALLAALVGWKTPAAALKTNSHTPPLAVLAPSSQSQSHVALKNANEAGDAPEP